MVRGYMQICTDNFLQGDCYTIGSGWGIANFGAINGCDWFGHCWQFANSISSVKAVGQNALLFDRPHFNPAGGIHVVGSNTQHDLAAVSSLDNATESAFVYW